MQHGSLARHDDYLRGALDDGDLDPDPLVQLGRWLADAEAAGLAEPNAMVLSTLGDDGPTSRTVLLKGVTGGALEFVTNAGSRKGRALAADGRVALLFPWYGLQRQVLVDGDALPAPAAMSDAYWASRQSAPIADRAALDARSDEVARRFAGEAVIPRPPFWGAWLVTPRRVEFWQGRASRLHDRLVYSPGAGGWTIGRVQP